MKRCAAVILPVLVTVALAAPAGAKPLKKADSAAVFACIGIGLETQARALGLPPNAGEIADSADNLDLSRTKGAHKIAKQLTRASGSVALIRAVTKAESWCVALGQGPT